MKVVEELTQEQATNLFNYKDDKLYWRVNRGNNKLIGKPAGNFRKDGYCVTRINKIPYLNHRLIWLYVYGEFPSKFIDHIDGNPSNNRLDNLREANNTENNWNKKMQSNNTSGYKGVDWNKNMAKWRAKASVDGKSVHLGYYSTPEEAAIAYQNFTLHLHADFYKDTSPLISKEPYEEKTNSNL